MDLGQGPRQSNSTVHAFTLYCNHRVINIWEVRGYTHDECPWALWSVQFQCDLHLGLYTRGTHACSLHAYSMCAEMCLKAAYCMHGKLRYHMVRVGAYVYNVCVCVPSVYFCRVL